MALDKSQVCASVPHPKKKKGVVASEDVNASGTTVI